MNENLNSIIDLTMDKVRSIVDADTVLGTPVTVGGSTIIPVSKITLGLATGGTDFGAKSEKTMFGGGGAAGVSVLPIGLVVFSGTAVKFVPISNELTTLDRALQAAPEIIDKLKEVVTDR